MNLERAFLNVHDTTLFGMFPTYIPLH